tara:strand:+ start:150 stop:875 length:726 start_codon:yes stop_codon:yes gene_type:complete
MKKIYFKTILIFCILLTSLSQAQTYNIDTTGQTCPNSGIDATFACAIDGQPAVDLGSFTDTNTSGLEVSSISLTIYGACSGDVEFFINGTSIATGTATGLSCSCQSIASDPNIPQNYTVTMTPAIIAAYVIGGSNTLSVSASNSAAGAQCFYGADVMVTTATLGVDDVKFNSIKTYPNPASDFITISGLKNKENFRVYDVLGTEILRGVIIDNGEILIKNFSNGLYFLKFDNGNTIKFLKE